MKIRTCNSYESAEKMILEKYQKHMISDPIDSYTYTSHIVSYYPHVSPLLMMAMVNLLLEDDKEVLPKERPNDR